MRNSEYIEEMNKINNKTREDIIEIIEKTENKIFGVKAYNFEIIEDLKNDHLYNFSVDFIFEDRDKEEVKKIIEEYNKNVDDKNYMDLTEKALKELEKYIIYYCYWR